MPFSVTLTKAPPEGPRELRGAVRKSLDLLGDPLSAIGPESMVLIKPNITADAIPWQTGVVTNPNLVKAIVEVVQERGPKRVIIAEAIAVSLDVKKGFKFLGYDKIASQTGAELVDLYDEEFLKVEVKDGLHQSLEISRPVLEADFLINVPVLKTHVAVGMTACMKNLMGTISTVQKKRFHYFGLAESVVDLITIVKPRLNIVDATIAGEGNGPIGNDPVGLNLILAGTDARAVDLVCADLMGFEPSEVKVLAEAENRWGQLSSASIQVRGEALENVARDFRRASNRVRPIQGIDCRAGEECPTCAGVVDLALARAQEMGLLEGLKPLTIICGPDAKPPAGDEKLLVVGRCLAEHQSRGDYIPGCPPQVFLVADQIREMAGLDRIFGDPDGYTF
jgi:uncharacterized protein (DUF362 family)